MAEETGELKSLDRTTGGTGKEEFLEKRDDRYSDVDIREFGVRFEDEPPDTEQIKARIEETRNQMGETIDAIQERLSVANISEQVSETVSSAIETAKDTAYDATVGKAVNFMKNVGDGVSHSAAFRTVKKNPFPLALIGLGAGMLAYQSFGRTSSSRKGNGRASGGGFFAGADGRTDDRSTFDSAKRTIGNATRRAYDGIADKANTAIEGVSNVAGTAYESVTGGVSNAYSEAGGLATRAYDRVGEYGTLAHEKYDEYLEEHPLALGALALAVGAAVGFAIPTTQFEDKLMGDAREHLVQRAQDAADSLIDRAKHAADHTIKDEARALGH
jgi:ElaB/YqjD/DUF883 family membrane-anchored ribosome-binding protein